MITKQSTKQRVRDEKENGCSAAVKAGRELIEDGKISEEVMQAIDSALLADSPLRIGNCSSDSEHA